MWNKNLEHTFNKPFKRQFPPHGFSLVLDFFFLSLTFELSDGLLPPSLTSFKWSLRTHSHQGRVRCRRFQGLAPRFITFFFSPPLTHCLVACDTRQPSPRAHRFHSQRCSGMFRHASCLEGHMVPLQMIKSPCRLVFRFRHGPWRFVAFFFFFF